MAQCTRWPLWPANKDASSSRVVCAAELSTAHAAQLGQLACAVSTTIRRLVALAAVRDRRQIRRIGLDQQAVERASMPRRLLQLDGLGKGDDAARSSMWKPRASASSRLARSAGEAVHDAAAACGPSARRRIAQRIVPGLARVDHDGLAGLAAISQSAVERPRAAPRAARSRSDSRARSRRSPPPSDAPRAPSGRSMSLRPPSTRRADGRRRWRR